jgi:hypothetical protein
MSTSKETHLAVLPVNAKHARFGPVSDSKRKMVFYWLESVVSLSGQSMARRHGVIVSYFAAFFLFVCRVN